MKKDEKHLPLRIDENLLRQFEYIAKYDNRSMNWFLLSLIKKSISEFEEVHGKINITD